LEATGRARAATMAEATNRCVFFMADLLDLRVVDLWNM
jgi:hypothetical protein